MDISNHQRPFRQRYALEFMNESDEKIATNILTDRLKIVALEIIGYRLSKENKIKSII